MFSFKEVEKVGIKEGSFIITEGKTQFPTGDDRVIIPMKGFNSISVRGKISNAMATVSFKVRGSIKYPLLANPSTKTIDESIKFPFMDDDGIITFSVEKQSKANSEEKFSAEIEFKLLNLTP